MSKTRSLTARLAAVAVWQCLFFLGLAAAEDPAGYKRSVFDGKTLHGWSVENGARAAVENGELVITEGDGWLRSHHEYADFLWHVEWKAEKEADYDAGLYIRTAREGAPFPKRGYQINLLQDKEGWINPLPDARTSGLIKRGEWNAFDVQVVGDTVSLSINGKPAYKAAGLADARGYIGIQVEVPKGGRFRFRNMEVTELGYASLFDGATLAGWEPADRGGASCWRVAGGVLECTGGRGTWLRSKEQYGDFNLRLEYQISADGNSGVYVRVPADGNHHRDNENEPPAGFEVQVLDDHAEKHRGLKDYQYSAGVYDFAGAAPRVSKTAGEWNTLEIDCQGEQVTITHNGEAVCKVTPETHPLFALRQTSGFLGLQNHNSPVKFRAIRIQSRKSP